MEIDTPHAVFWMQYGRQLNGSAGGPPRSFSLLVRLDSDRLRHTRTLFDDSMAVAVTLDDNRALHTSFGCTHFTAVQGLFFQRSLSVSVSDQVPLIHLLCGNDNFEAIACVQFLHQNRHVVFYGLLADLERNRDRFIRQPTQQ